MRCMNGIIHEADITAEADPILFGAFLDAHQQYPPAMPTRGKWSQSRLALVLGLPPATCFLFCWQIRGCWEQWRVLQRGFPGRALCHAIGSTPSQAHSASNKRCDGEAIIEEEHGCNDDEHLVGRLQHHH